MFDEIGNGLKFEENATNFENLGEIFHGSPKDRRMDTEYGKALCLPIIIPRRTLSYEYE